MAASLIAKALVLGETHQELADLLRDFADKIEDGKQNDYTEDGSFVVEPQKENPDA